LAAANIANLTSLGTYLSSKIGQGYYKSWADMATLLNSLDIPQTSHTITTASTVVLPDSIANNLLSTLGTGSGPFNTPTLVDYLGSVAGIPHTGLLTICNSNYSNVDTTNLVSSLRALDQSLVTFVNQIYTDISANTSTATLAPVQSAVTSVNTALNNQPTNVAFYNGLNAYYLSLNHLATEVSNIPKGGIIFDAGYSGGLKGFAQRIGSAASDQSSPAGSYYFFANLITNDAGGDIVSSVIAENINTQKLSIKGVTVNNDPNPSLLLGQAQAQGIPLSTYINQNK